MILALGRGFPAGEREPAGRYHRRVGYPVCAAVQRIPARGYKRKMRRSHPGVMTGGSQMSGASPVHTTDRSG